MIFMSWFPYLINLIFFSYFIQPGAVSSEFMIDTTSFNIQENPRVAYGAGRYLVVWMENGDQGWDIKGKLITPCGSELTTVVISEGEWDEMYPDVFYLDGFFQVVWQDNRNGNYSIYSARVDSLGNLLDPTGILISGSGSNISPKITGVTSTPSSNSTFLCVWEEESTLTIKGRFLYPDGTISPEILEIEEGEKTAVTGFMMEVDSVPTPCFLLLFYPPYWLGYIHGRRLTVSGDFIDPQPVFMVEGENFSVIDFHLYDGVHFIVVHQITTTCNCAIILSSIFDSTLNLISSHLMSDSIQWGNWNVEPSCAIFQDDALVIWSSWWDTRTSYLKGRYFFDGSWLEFLSETPNAGKVHIKEGPSGEVILVYQAIPGPPYNGTRIYGKFLQDLPSYPEPPILSLEPPITYGDTNMIIWDGEGYDYYAECSEDSNFISIYQYSGWIVGNRYTFSSLNPNTVYYYRVKARNVAGESRWSNVVSSLQLPLRIWEREINEITMKFSSNLSQEGVSIGFSLLKSENVKIIVYNSLGRKIKTLFEGHLDPGHYSLIWDGRNEIGIKVPAGVYFIKYQIGKKEGTFRQLLFH